MKEIRLYGHLARRFGRRFYFEVSTPAEAIRALCANFKDFRSWVMEHNEPGYRIIVGSEAREIEMLNAPSGDMEVIKIVPVIAGAKSGLGQVILGAAIMFVAWWNPMGWAATGMLSTATLSSIGASMVLGGVSMMLAPTPKALGAPDKPDNKPSYGFDGPVNTAAQGNPVPVLYGELIVGSQVISAGLSTEQILITGSQSSPQSSSTTLLSTII